MHREADATASIDVPQRQAPLLTALFAAGLCLRPPIVAVATLLPQIRGEFGLTYVQGGLLTAIPIFCMGLFALPAAALFGAVGARASLSIALGIIVAGGTLRAASPGAAELYALTVVAGIGAGLAGALLPAIVRQSFSRAPGRGTGVYSFGINGGASLGAVLAIPLANLTGGWRGLSVAFGIEGLIALAIWLTFSGGGLAASRPVERSAAGARLPHAYYLGALFALQAVCFFGLNAWLPSASLEWGWSAVHASWLVAALNFITVPASLLIGAVGDRLSRPKALCIASGVLCFGLAGMALLPALIWIWTAVAGLACGALFPLIMTMTVDAAKDPREAASIASVTLAVGYVVAGLSPVALGAIREMATDFTSAFAFLAAVALILLAACLNLLRPRPTVA